MPDGRTVRGGAERNRPDKEEMEGKRARTGYPPELLRATSWRAIVIRWISLVPSPMHNSGASR